MTKSFIFALFIVGLVIGSVGYSIDQYGEEDGGAALHEAMEKVKKDLSKQDDFMGSLLLLMTLVAEPFIALGYTLAKTFNIGVMGITFLLLLYFLWYPVLYLSGIVVIVLKDWLKDRKRKEAEE